MAHVKLGSAMTEPDPARPIECHTGDGKMAACHDTLSSGLTLGQPGGGASPGAGLRSADAPPVILGGFSDEAQSAAVHGAPLTPAAPHWSTGSGKCFNNTLAAMEQGAWPF